jgi:hypothetical protein
METAICDCSNEQYMRKPMHKTWNRSEIGLDRINDVFAGETVQDALNAAMVTLVPYGLTHSENDKGYPSEFVEDLLRRFRA